MYKREKSIIYISKNHISIISLLISLAVISILALFIINDKRDNNKNSLINVLCTQRLLTQMMTKDSNVIYELQNRLKSYSGTEDKKLELMNELKLSTEALIKTSSEYERQYETIRAGYILLDNKAMVFKDALTYLKPTLDKQDILWKDFNDSIRLLINEKADNSKVERAIKFINNNNSMLLQHSDEIAVTVISHNDSKGIRQVYIAIVLVAIILIILFLFLKNAYKNLLAPIHQIYKELPDTITRGYNKVDMASDGKEISSVYTEVREVFDKLNSLISLIEDLNKNIPFKQVLENIYNSFCNYIPYNYLGVALLEEDKEMLTACYGISDEDHKRLSERILGYTENINKTGLVKVIEKGEIRVINDLEKYLRDKPHNLYNKILLEEGINSSIVVPLKNENKVFGVIFFYSNVKDAYASDHLNFIKVLVNSITMSLEKEILINNMTIASTVSLATLTEERDPETGEHLIRMRKYSRVIAELLATSEKYRNVIDMDYINNIEKFSSLHDIGKVAIKDDILLKPGKLTSEEFEVMKTHTTYGAKVLRLAEDSVKKNGRSIFKIGIDIAEGHHEKWDGTGYPYGKKGEEIPLSARIVAVADVFDALTSNRPYKKALSLEESIRIINEGDGTHFDPDIIKLFNENIHKIKEVYYRYNT